MSLLESSDPFTFDTKHKFEKNNEAYYNYQYFNFVFHIILHHPMINNTCHKPELDMFFHLY